ncbi:hypothetical protein M409DRAFT_18951 [Zasmidium cellare ATCC 36951]|uniref:Uncharacterized protein n=1 Tax=Zasmidium cellare ATCC 36951 TaxID=1080233 RepID=A0A6A6CYU1_ZASCE|nr:uncharacterized protein M409DRAFT_18951 [Zasmidium cellare ATCC 36951]KAF2170979.1 hypothetical protein M409DRAFT_18951 [Zasmidium cellare ATCC 36951]
MLTYFLNLLFPKSAPQPTLLSLPPETRLNIYTTLFPPLKLHLTPLTPSNPLPEPPILHTTSLLRSEALPIFYSAIEVHIPTFHRTTPPERVGVLIGKIPEGQIKQIRRFVVPWTLRFEVTVQLSPNPWRRAQSDGADGGGLAVGEKHYVVVRSMRANISEEFCEKFTEAVLTWIEDLLESHEEKGLYLNAKDLCSLVANINRHAPTMLRQVCGISV